MKRLLALFLAIVLLFSFVSCQKLPLEDTSSAVLETTSGDKIIPYTENWKDDYFTGEENKIIAESGRNKNIKAYVARYDSLYRNALYLIYEDGEVVIIRELGKEIYESTNPNEIWLRDLDGDKVDEIILPNAYTENGRDDTLVYKITDNGFEEFLNTKDLSDYGYYLAQSDYNNHVNIKNKYTETTVNFNGVSANNKYFYDENGNFKTDIILEYSNTATTSLEDINGDGVFEIIIERYAVVKGCRKAVLTKTIFSYNGEKFVVIDAKYDNYTDNKTRRISEIDSGFGRDIIIAELPAFEEGDTVYGEKFIFWFIVNELTDHEKGIITPYYQPYLYDGNAYSGTYKIPKKLVQEVIKENFAVEISSQWTKYDAGDYYAFTRTGFGPTVGASLDSLNKDGENMIVNYKIILTPSMISNEGRKELGTMEIAIDNNGKGKVLYFRPKYYE